ncbi:MAG TPA: hypothetical protein VFZ25_02025, partial [Chloroflexota bacterium]|nr:hypothetical protein [Chloroflexota bacterium]
MREHRTRREPVRWQLCARICVALTFVILAAIEMAGSVYRPAYAASNPIVGENQQPGTGEWQIPNSKGQAVADDVNNQIKGYASLPSVNKGSNITFFVTVNPSQTFSLDIYRMGYYQGLGGRLMASVGPISGISQSACP